MSRVHLLTGLTEIEYFFPGTVDSTNSYAKNMIKSGVAPGAFAVVTDCQTAGRGRLGRSWQSPAGESLCLSLAINHGFVPAVTMLAALGVVSALEPLCSATLQLKWPNDIISGNKKLCGILTEQTCGYTVFGVGVNVSGTHFAPDIADKATSLRLLGAKSETTADIPALARSVCDSVISQLNTGTFDRAAQQRYSALCASLGRRITFSGKNGIAESVAPDGSLLVRVGDKLVSVCSGEVTQSDIY